MSTACSRRSTTRVRWWIVNKRAFFVTGTDTGVGKTLVAAGLLLAAGDRGYRTAGIKPVAAGAEIRQGANGEQLVNEDAVTLQSVSTLQAAPVPAFGTVHSLSASHVYGAVQSSSVSQVNMHRMGG